MPLILLIILAALIFGAVLVATGIARDRHDRRDDEDE